MTAYVRNPGKVPSSWRQNVIVVTGELSDDVAVDRAVQGADAVVSALGPSLERKATDLPLVEGTRNIVTDMQRDGVRRYVGNGTPACSTSGKCRPGRPGCRPSWRRPSCAAPATSSSA